MNERLVKLTEQCYEYNETMQGAWFNKTKFAELIIRECAKACDDVSKDSFGDWRGGAWECETAILERFGVEK